MEKGYPLLLYIFRSPSPKDDLCQVWSKLVQWFWRRFQNYPTPFLHFCDYLPLEEDLALYLSKLEFPSPKDDLCQVWLKFAKWFWRRRFLKIFSAFSLFRYNYLPLERGYPLPLYKLESHLPKDDLCQFWLKLTQWFWRRRFLNNPTHFCIFVIISPLKRTWPFILTM